MMMRHAYIPVCGATLVAVLATPAVASAAEGPAAAPAVFGLVVSLGGLAVAIVLLVEALYVRRIASGGAIAEHLAYVVLATVCLGASALAQWTQNFVGGVTYGQIQLASELLVTVAMGLLAAYFFGVRRIFESYLRSMGGSSETAQVAGSPVEHHEA